MTDCLAHVPGLAMSGEAAAQVAGGELCLLPFDEWQAMESEFSFADRHYEGSRPVFYRREVLAADQEEFAEIVARLHRALLLATAGWAPEPRLSAMYFRSPGGGVQRMIGPYGRELIVYAPERRDEVTGELLARLEHHGALLSADAERPPDGNLEAALQTLERTTRPEFGPLNRFMHEMIALEQLMLPEVRHQLTDTFARRIAAVVDDPNTANMDGGRLLYQMRSELIHGHDIEEQLAQRGLEPDQLLWFARLTLTAVIHSILLWRSAAADDEQADLARLRAALDGAQVAT
jgi:hypothetical protein